jgi:hypothetical protein
MASDPDRDPRTLYLFCLLVFGTIVVAIAFTS